MTLRVTATRRFKDCDCAIVLCDGREGDRNTVHKMRSREAELPLVRQLAARHQPASARMSYVVASKGAILSADAAVSSLSAQIQLHRSLI